MIKAFKGESGIVEPTFVYLPGVPGGDAVAKATGVDFFSVPVALGVSPPPKSPFQANKSVRWLGEGHQHPGRSHRAGEEAPRGVDGRPQGQHRKGHRLHQEPSTKVNAPSGDCPLHDSRAR